MKKPILILTGLVVVIFLLTIARAVVSNTLATSGVGLSKLTTEIDTYQREASILEEKILKKSSYTNLKEEAGKQGYEAGATQIVMSSSLPLAYNK